MTDNNVRIDIQNIHVENLFITRDALDFFEGKNIKIKYPENISKQIQMETIENVARRYKVNRQTIIRWKKKEIDNCNQENLGNVRKEKKDMVLCRECKKPIKSNKTGVCRNCFNSYRPGKDCTLIKRKFFVDKKELHRLVWEMPTEKVGIKFGVTGKAIEKRCKSLGVVKPPRGYWAKKIANKINAPVAELVDAPDLGSGLKE